MTASLQATGLKKYIPTLSWLPAYQPPWLRADLLAGLTTAAVVIPQAMAYATLAGLPVEVGLYASLTPMVVYALLGTSRVLSASVTSTLSLLTAAVLATTVSTTDPNEILVVLGIVLLVYALRRGLLARDEDDAAAAWLQTLRAVSPAQAALVGVAFLALDPKDWLVKLAAVNLIAEADLGGTASLLAYLWFVLLAQSLVLIPLILVLTAPGKAQKSLGSLNARLERNERTIEIGFAVVVGVYFLYKGLEHLGIFS